MKIKITEKNKKFYWKIIFKNKVVAHSKTPLDSKEEAESESYFEKLKIKYILNINYGKF